MSSSEYWVWQQNYLYWSTRYFLRIKFVIPSLTFAVQLINWTVKWRRPDLRELISECSIVWYSTVLFSKFITSSFAYCFSIFIWNCRECGIFSNSVSNAENNFFVIIVSKVPKWDNLVVRSADFYFSIINNLKCTLALYLYSNGKKEKQASSERDRERESASVGALRKEGTWHLS